MWYNDYNYHYCTCPMSHTRLGLVSGLTIYLFSGFWVSYNGWLLNEFNERLYTDTNFPFSLSLPLSLPKLSLSLSLLLFRVLGYSHNLTPSFSNPPFSPLLLCIYSLRIMDWVMIAFWYHLYGWGLIWLFLTKIGLIGNRN